MRRLHYFFVVALLGCLILLPGQGLAQGDNAGRSLGLTPGSGSLPIWTPGSASGRQLLGNIARTHEPAVFIVGNAKVGKGTAWVISKKHRLLATNAHVADLLYASGSDKMLAIPSGLGYRYVVNKVWYHPGVHRFFQGDVRNSIQSTNPAEGKVDGRSSDVAVLQLAPEGPELPVEFSLGTLEELKNLYGQEVAMIGYPGTDTAGFPAPGENAIATFHDGVVSRITDFRYSTNAPWGELQYVQYTMASWGGFSGSPVFLPNGRVVALHNSSRTVDHKITGEVRSIAHGIRLDALWELLVYHKLLDKIDAKIDPGQVSLERFLKPDPKAEKLRQDFSQAVALVAEASHLIFVNQNYDPGVEKCSAALSLMPDYARAYYVRANGYLNNWFENRRRMSRNYALGLLFNAEDDANKYAKLAPSDPQSIILVCLVLNNLGSFTGEREANRKALGYLEKFVTAENLTNYTRAEAHSAMGVAYDNLGDKRRAIEEHNEAIRLAPDYAILYENRADFWHYRGRRDLERADYAKARELRQKQQSPR